MSEKKKSLTKWLYWFILGVAIIGVYKLLDNISSITRWVGELFDILMPFIIGLLIAYLLYIPCRGVESFYKRVLKQKWVSKKARGMSIITVYIISILIIVLTLNFIIPNVLKSTTDFLNNFGNYYSATLQNYNNLPENSFLKNEIITQAIQSISEIDFKQYFNIEKIFEYAKGAINAVSGIFNIFVALIVSAYLLAQRNRILNFLRRFSNAVFSRDMYEIVSRYFHKSNEVFFRFVASQILDAFIIGTLTSIAMSIIGVKYAVLLGMIIGLFNLIPYFGAIIAVIIAIVVTIFTGGIGQAFFMAIVIIILQQIDANIINPKITGTSLAISPLLVIFAVTVGGACFGVMGMFLAVPVATVIKLLIEEYIDYKNKNKIEN